MNLEEEQRFAESVRTLRERNGWSQGELARQMAALGWENYSQMTVRRTEKSERPIRLAEALDLARLFSVGLGQMTSGLSGGAEVHSRLLDARRELLKAHRAVEISISAYVLATKTATEALRFAEDHDSDIDEQTQGWIDTLISDTEALLKADPGMAEAAGPVSDEGPGDHGEHPATS